MKIKELFTIEKKEDRSFTTRSGEERTFSEYVIKNTLEREDGSLVETFLTATASDSVGELATGAKYNLTVFITSRTSGSGETERHWPAFRITAAEKVADAPAAAKVEAAPVEIGDEVPF